MNGPLQRLAQNALGAAAVRPRLGPLHAPTAAAEPLMVDASSGAASAQTRPASVVVGGRRAMRDIPGRPERPVEVRALSPLVTPSALALNEARTPESRLDAPGQATVHRSLPPVVVQLDKRERKAESRQPVPSEPPPAAVQLPVAVLPAQRGPLLPERRDAERTAMPSLHPEREREPSIEVSIGRIEVRAPPPLQPAPRPQRAGPALMSLEDYLSGKRERRS